MREAAITGTGSYVPERVVTNAELSAILGEDINEFVSTTLGIRERRYCAPNESTADLAAAAAERALKSACVMASELDLVIVATDTPEYISPATAPVVQARIGALKAGAFDINSACAGFVTALDVAWKYIRADEHYNRVLVIGAYAMSKFVDPHDKKTSTSGHRSRGFLLPSFSRMDDLLREWAYSPEGPLSRSPRKFFAKASGTSFGSSPSIQRK
jgi:3-oxoacyl-[acyl-carrier-protein] synthase-3